MSASASPRSARWEARRRTMARVGHLIPRRQVEVERAARLLRAHFIDRRRRAPKHGRLHWLMLVGKYAGGGQIPDRERGDLSKYEIWAFVDHEAYKGMNRYWGLARAVVDRALRGRAEVTLSVFTIDEVDRFRAAGNSFLTSRYDEGIILYDRAVDGPKDAEALAIDARLNAVVAALPAQPREAFHAYRQWGLSYSRIAWTLACDEPNAEMHLAAAFGTLLATLGDASRPRSLRPHLVQHPRYNLDLFHRPGDYDRVLAVALYRRALAFVDLMGREGAPRSIVINSAAYAAEFSLKSFLLRAGRSDDWTRQAIGLDLDMALSHACDAGLDHYPQAMERLRQPLARYHMHGRSSGLAAQVETAMQLPVVIAVVSQLVGRVGDSTGYSGLPPEQDA